MTQDWQKVKPWLACCVKVPGLYSIIVKEPGKVYEKEIRFPF